MSSVNALSVARRGSPLRNDEDDFSGRFSNMRLRSDGRNVDAVADYDPQPPRVSRNDPASFDGQRRNPAVLDRVSVRGRGAGRDSPVSARDRFNDSDRGEPRGRSGVYDNDGPGILRSAAGRGVFHREGSPSEMDNGPIPGHQSDFHDPRDPRDRREERPRSYLEDSGPRRRPDRSGYDRFDRHPDSAGCPARNDFDDRGGNYGRRDADFGNRGSYNLRPGDDDRQESRYDCDRRDNGSGYGRSIGPAGDYDGDRRRRSTSPHANIRNPRQGGYRNALPGFRGRSRGRGRDHDDFNDRPSYGRIGHRDNFRNGFRDERGTEKPRVRAPSGYMPQEQSAVDIMKNDRLFAQAYGRDMVDADTDMVVSGAGANTALENWNDVKLDPELLKNIKSSGYIRPRKVQRFAIPLIMENYDLRCQSETGSGKTAAFLIPIIQSLITSRNDGRPAKPGAPCCLVLGPTRELVKQIYDQAVKFAYSTGVTVAFAYGETSVSDNISKINRGCEILCATLGRLTHFVDHAILSLDEIEYLVIDEADRFMDHAAEGFTDFLRSPQLPSRNRRQTLLFSATLDTQGIDDISRHFLRAKCATLKASAQTNTRLKYEIFAVAPKLHAKVDAVVATLHRLTKRGNNADKNVMRVLVFVNRKIYTDMVATKITQAGFASTTIHGDRGQDLREEALGDFKSGRKPILVATDVAARGVDIQNLDYVIQMDLPTDIRCFVQRSGRCGRTHPGTAISFYCEADVNIRDEIVNTMRKNNQLPPVFLSQTYLDQEDYDIFTRWVRDAAAPERPVSATRDNAVTPSRSISPPPAQPSAEDDWD